MRSLWSTASWVALAAWAGSTGAAFAQTPAAPARQQASGPQAGPADVDVVRIYGDRVIEDPGSYSVIDSKMIQDTAANTPAEILNKAPGVNIQMNSGQELLVAIRSPVLPAGAGQGSFLVLEDGVPIRAPAFGNVNELFELHHETAQDIEVVRGPGSARYGSNAVHGIINVIDPEPGAQTGSTLMLSANTLQRNRADATANLKAGGVDIWTGLSLIDDNGWRDASSVDQQKFTIRAGWHGEDWRSVATLSANNLNQETAGFIIGKDAYKNEHTATTNPNPEAYRDAWDVRTNVRFEKQFGGNTLTVTPFALTQRMIFIQHFLPDQSTEKNGHDSYGVMTRYDFGPENVRWSVGLDVQGASGFLKEIQTRPSFSGPVSNPTFPQGIHYDYDVDTLMEGLYGELAWKFAPGWSMLAGLRAEHHNYDYTTHKAPGVYGRYRIAPSRTDTYDLLTPKLGFNYTGFDWGTLYFNYSRGERAPQTSDQYRLQNLQTTDRLKVETIDSVEIGARGAVGGVHYDVAAYTMKKEHFFFRDSDGLNVPDGKTDHTGIEAALDGEIAQVLGGTVVWNGNVTWTDQTYAFNRTVAAASEIIKDGNKIDTAPEWLGDFGLGWRTDKLTLMLSGEWVGEYFTDAANLHQYPGHFVTALRGSWRFTDSFEAFGVVRNLTDERYADRADFASNQDRYFPGEPLNLTLGIRVKN